MISVAVFITVQVLNWVVNHCLQKGCKPMTLTVPLYSFRLSWMETKGFVSGAL